MLMDTAEQENSTNSNKSASLINPQKKQGLADQHQYLTFIMQGEEYGVDILSVQEIRGWGHVSPIPNAPTYVRGVINLRGAIVPVIDLRMLFELPNYSYNEHTVVIIHKLTTDRVNRIMGIVVDAMSDVCTIFATDKQPPPNVSQGVSYKFIEGLTEVKGKMVVLLSSELLLSLANNG
jgi:purine-binding chemotaxis protein CheW